MEQVVKEQVSDLMLIVILKLEVTKCLFLFEFVVVRSS